MAGSISGKVSDSNGSPLKIKVQALGVGGGHGSATTDSRGNYQITNLNAGTYTVMLEATGRFTPPSYIVHLAQNGNLTDKNFQKQ